MISVWVEDDGAWERTYPDGCTAAYVYYDGWWFWSVCTRWSSEAFDEGKASTLDEARQAADASLDGLESRR